MIHTDMTTGVIEKYDKLIAKVCVYKTVGVKPVMLEKLLLV